jgi:hypothetical protein
MFRAGSETGGAAKAIDPATISARRIDSRIDSTGGRDNAPDPVEAALAKALEVAARAGDVPTIAALTAELAARRRGA